MRSWFRLPPPLPQNEQQRQREVDLLATGSDTLPDLDEIATAAASLFRAPAALVTIVDKDKVLVIGSFNAQVRSMHRAEALCAHGVAQPGEVLCVPDLLEDERFAHLPITRGAEPIRFYVGTPLVTASGSALGMLCVVDRFARPRPAVEYHQALRRLATAALARLRRRETQASEADLAAVRTGRA